MVRYQKVEFVLDERSLDSIDRIVAQGHGDLLLRRNLMELDAGLRTELERDRHRDPDNRYYAYIDRLLIICEAHEKVIIELIDQVKKLEERQLF